TTNLTSKEAKMGKVMRHTLGASLNIRHNLSSSKGPKPLQLKLLTTYIPKTSAFTLAFSTSQRLDRKSGSAGMPRPSSYAVFCLKKKIVPGERGELPGHRLRVERRLNPAHHVGHDQVAVPV